VVAAGRVLVAVMTRLANGNSDIPKATGRHRNRELALTGSSHGLPQVVIWDDATQRDVKAVQAVLEILHLRAKIFGLYSDTEGNCPHVSNSVILGERAHCLSSVVCPRHTQPFISPRTPVPQSPRQRSADAGLKG